MANNEGQGVLFKNAQKLNEKSPDYSGSINIGGKDVKFSGWIKTSKTGMEYISLAVNKLPPQKKEPQKVEMVDDDIPWR